MIESLEGRRLLAGDGLEPVFTETFNEPAGNVTGVSEEGVRWNSSAGDDVFRFRTDGSSFIARQARGPFNVWQTELVDLGGEGRLDVTLSSSGPLEASGDFRDSLRVEVVAADGNVLARQAYEGNLPGDRVELTLDGFSADQVLVRIFATNTSGDETYRWDDVKLSRVTPAAGEVTVTAENGVIFITGTEGDDDLFIQLRLEEDYLSDGFFDGTVPVDVARLDVFSGGELVTSVFADSLDGRPNTSFRGFVVDLGDGDDTFAAGEADYFFTHPFLEGSGGSDPLEVNGGAGADDIVIYAGSYDDGSNGTTIQPEVSGGDGDDTIRLITRRIYGSTSGFANGDAGNDTITAVDGSFLIDGGTGNDTLTGSVEVYLTGSGRYATLLGGEGDDVLNPGGFTDADGGAGNDLINTSGGGFARSGNRAITGGDGEDTIVVGPTSIGLDLNGGTDGDTLDLRPLGGDLNVTFDGLANDDPAGRDARGNERFSNIGSDFETVLGLDDGDGETLYSEPFDEPQGSKSGTIEGVGGGGTWQTFTRLDDPQRYGVDGGRFQVFANNEPVVWFTNQLDISGGPVSGSIRLESLDTNNPTFGGRVRAFIRVDGVQQLIGEFTGGTAFRTVGFEGVTGSTLQVEVQFFDAGQGYAIDDFIVTRDGAGGGVRIDGDTIVGTDGADNIELQYSFSGADDFPSYAVLVDGERIGTMRTIDLIDLRGGNDTLRYVGGIEDPLPGGTTVRGGDGDDVIDLQAGTFLVEGNAGNDTITAVFSSRLFGGSGNDTFITGERAQITAEGNTGNDTFIARSSGMFTAARGGEGNDVFDLRVSSTLTTTTAFGGAGDDLLIAGGAVAIFDGGAGTDTADYAQIFPGNDAVVTLDGIANDGPPNKARPDNITGIENVLGGSIDDGNTGDGEMLYREPFEEPNGSKSGVINGGGTWRVFDRNATGEEAVVAVQDGRFVFADLEGQLASWFTSQLDIAGGPVDVSLDVSSEFVRDARLTVQFRVDGQVVSSQRFNGDFGSDTATLENVTGSTLQVEVITSVATGSYAIDDLTVTRPGGGGSRIFAQIEDGVLVVTGTDAADEIIVNVEEIDGQVFTIVKNAVSNGEVIGRFAGLPEVRVEGRGGDDLLLVSRSVTVDKSPVDVGTGATLLGGEGADNLILSEPGIADGGAGDDTVFGRENATVIGGDGDDELGLFSTFSGDIAVGEIRGGAGNDLMRIRSMPGGADALVDGGSGNDRFETDVDGGIDYTGGDGTDTFAYTGDARFEVRRDDLANDGVVGGPADANIRSDVEVLEGVFDPDGPADVLFSEPFDEVDGARSGSIDGVGGGTWDVFDRNTGVIAVDGGRLVFDGPQEVVSWYTSRLDISGGPVDLSLELGSVAAAANGRLTVLVRVDGQLVQAPAVSTGDFGSKTFSLIGLVGETVQVEVQARNVTAGSYFIDDLTVTRFVPPTAVSATLVSGELLSITGTDGADDVRVEVSPTADSGTEVTVFSNDAAIGTFSTVTDVEVKLGGGDDVFSLNTVDGSDSRDTDLGNVTVFGGAGNDELRVGSQGHVGTIYAHGEEGNDTIALSSRLDSASVFGYGSVGDDVINILGRGTAFGGDGNDELFAQSLNGTAGSLVGDAGDDLLRGEWGAASGGEGNDTIEAGDNTGPEASGGAGDDTLLINRDSLTFFFGGDGIDAVDFRPLGRDPADVPVTLDDVLNDGPTGQQDVRSDVENVLK